MSRNRLSLPRSAWPQDIADRFDKAFAHATPAQRPRLEQGLGRWLLAAERDDLPPELITPGLIAARARDMPRGIAYGMKQALFAVFEEVTIFVPEERVVRETELAELARNITRNLHRLPDDWRRRAEPALAISEDGLCDGAIIDARAPAAVKRMLETAWAFFDFCRDKALPLDLSPKTFAARADHRQQQFRAGAFSISTMVVEAQNLLALSRDLFPERDVRWLVSFIERMKKQARLHPTRNNGRVVALEELRIAAAQASRVARRAHAAATGYQARLRAHTLARTALAILVLVNSPIRLSCLADLDLEKHFDPGFSRLYLSADETKDGKRDVRLLAPDLRQALLAYLEMHRPLVAPKAETALFVGRGGKRCKNSWLSQKMGFLAEALFGKRVTPHVMRNVIAAFIVSEAPEEAGLAGEIMQHSVEPTTETYRATANQIKASRKLAAATDARAKAVSVPKGSKPKGKVRRADVLARRGRSRPGGK